MVSFIEDVDLIAAECPVIARCPPGAVRLERAETCDFEHAGPGASESHCRKQAACAYGGRTQRAIRSIISPSRITP
jgi:hypothetical protein